MALLWPYFVALWPALNLKLVGAFLRAAPGPIVPARSALRRRSTTRCDTCRRDVRTRARIGTVGSSALLTNREESDADAPVIRQAKAWVRDVVVKLRLCPFAEGVFNADGGVRYVVTPAENADQLWAHFLFEVDYLMAHTRQEAGTTLLIAPHCLRGLEDFNDFCASLEDTIENDEVLVDQVLVACFHPKHAFHGLDEDNVLNYEKRSPHPTINLLRADVVDEYIALGKTTGIAEHNEKRLLSEGKGAVKAAFEATLELQ